MYAVRNETEDRTLRDALEKISCISDPNNEIHDEINDDKRDPVKVTDPNYEYYDEKSDLDILYDEPKVVKLYNAVKLTDLPVKSLPCPKELLRTMEESHGHPIQNEIRLKAYSDSDKIVQHRLAGILTIMALLFLI